VSYICDTLDDGLLKPKHVVKEHVQKIHVKFICECGIGVLLYFILHLVFVRISTERVMMCPENS
jgi:hypothetical protein